MSAKDWAQHFGTLWQIAVNEGSPGGGRGKGQLTQNAIRKMTIYYNRAIRGSNSVDSMKKAVMASLHHCFSTDDRPRHELCPTGVDSWCFFQEALAKHQVPGPHDKLVHTPLNEKKLTPHLMPIYKRLSEDQLLSRCVSGKTQNANECLHSLIWARCAKDHFASRKRVQFAVATAAREFNFGAAASQDTANFFGFETGHHMKRLGAARMQRRVQNSIKYVKDRRNKRRDKVRAAKLKRLEELLVLEGGPAYAAGQFWSVGGVLHAVGHLHMLYWRYCVFLFWISSVTWTDDVLSHFSVFPSFAHFYYLGIKYIRNYLMDCHEMLHTGTLHWFLQIYQRTFFLISNFSRYEMLKSIYNVIFMEY